jgi:hypothetical protein
MRRPSLFDFAIGNAVARISILCASVCALYVFVQRHDNTLGGLSLAGVVLFRYAARARERVGTYRAWKESWGQMTDPGASPAAVPERGRKRRWRGRVALAVWLILALWLGSNPQMAGTASYTSVMWSLRGLTLWGVVAFLLRIVRRIRGARTPRPKAGEFIVRVVPGVPRSSPTPANIAPSLPAYCKRLMAGGSSPP